MDQYFRSTSARERNDLDEVLEHSQGEFGGTIGQACSLFALEKKALASTHRMSYAQAASGCWGWREGAELLIGDMNWDPVEVPGSIADTPSRAGSPGF